MSEPREFMGSIWEIWIDDLDGELAMEKCERAAAKIEVVEKVEYDKLEAALKEAAQTLEWIQSGVSGMFNDGEDKDKLIFDQAARVLARIEEVLK